MKTCRLCGKKALIGIDSTHKHGGKWALRGPATRKVWNPNLQKQKVVIEGKTQRIWLCIQCLRRVKGQMKGSIKLKELIIQTPSVAENPAKNPQTP